MNVSQAIRIANDAYQNSLDKTEQPVIRHSLRVMENCFSSGEDYAVVACLHDLIEDTSLCLKIQEKAPEDQIYQIRYPSWKIDEFELMGFLTEHQYYGLDAISRREGERYKVYIERCCENAIGRYVKLCDLQDNLSPARMYKLKEPERTGLKIRYLQSCYWISTGIWLSDKQTKGKYFIH